MKKLLIFLITIPILFISCTAEDGSDGIDGIDGVNGTDGIDGVNGTDGIDGVDGTAQVFQVSLNFNADNNFKNLVEFPTETIFNINHVVVVYRLVDIIVVNSPGTLPPGPPTYIWETVPSILYLDNETLYYGFKNSFKDILLFMDGSMNLIDLPSEFTQDIVFRIAILQANFISSVSTNNIEKMVNSMPNDEITFLN